MKDRVPEYPGRVRLVPVPGESGLYDLVRADEPSEVGTPINKETLLTDATEALIWGNTANRTVNDALAYIGDPLSRPIPGNYRGGVKVTVRDGNGVPVVGAAINGTGITDGNPNSDARGELYFYTTSASLTLSVVGGYVDLQDPTPQAVTVPAGGWATAEFTMAQQPVGAVLTYLTSTTVRVSPALKSVDLFLLGGGGAGAGGPSNGGGGGGGGYGKNVLNLQVVGGNYDLIVGSGGVGIVGAGGSGGTSSFMGNTAFGGVGGTTANATSGGAGGSGGGGSYSTAGGNGGTKGGNGGSSAAGIGGSGSGDADSLRPFKEGDIYYGGGGGGSVAAAGTPGTGGATGGGGGGQNARGTAGTSGTGGGGGGSGGGNTGANGGSGRVMIRIKAYN